MSASFDLKKDDNNLTPRIMFLVKTIFFLSNNCLVNVRCIISLMSTFKLIFHFQFFHNNINVLFHVIDILSGQIKSFKRYKCDNQGGNMKFKQLFKLVKQISSNFYLLNKLGSSIHDKLFCFYFIQKFINDIFNLTYL